MLLLAALAALAPRGAGARDLISVVGQFHNHDRLYPGTGPHWELERTLPFVQELGLATVFEMVFASTDSPRAFITYGRTDAATLQQVQENRALVDGWLATYRQAGIDVVLGAFGRYPRTQNDVDGNAEFFAWVADLVARHPNVVAVQFHNEPNLSFFWSGTPEQYVETYRPLAAAIKARRPDLPILVGAASSLWWGPGIGWTQRAVGAGMLDFADGIAVHPYSNEYPPEIDPHWRGASIQDPDHREKALTAFWDKVKTWNTAQRPLTLHFTEFGWSTSTGAAQGIDEATQADYLVRTFFIFQDVRLKGVPIETAHWYVLKDNGTDPAKLSYGYGLLTYDLSRRKPAFTAMKAIAAYFAPTDGFLASTRAVTAVAPAGPVKVKVWRRKSDQAEVIAFWSTASDGTSGATVPLELRVTGRFRSGQVYFADGQSPRAVPTAVEGSTTTIMLEAGSRPAWLQLDPG